MHGGHVAADAPTKGSENWAKAVAPDGRQVPMLIENTAGGDQAMARVSTGWPCCGTRSPTQAGEVGFCLDTCHAFASGEDLSTIVDRVKRGSTWCTGTTGGTSSARAATGTPGWRRAPWPGRCWLT